MKESLLRKLIREEVKKTLRKESDSAYARLGGSRPYDPDDMFKKVVEPNLDKDIIALPQFKDEAATFRGHDADNDTKVYKFLYPKLEGKPGKELYRSDNYQGTARMINVAIPRVGNVKAILATVLIRVGIWGVIYMNKNDYEKLVSVVN